MILLPNNPSKIGVFVSGGLDSAILYHMVLQANVDSKHNIVPLTVIKNSSSLQFVSSVVTHIQTSCKVPLVSPTILSGTQVKPAINQARRWHYTRVYVGLIKELPEFLLGWESTAYPDNDFFKAPFSNLTKIDIVKLTIEQHQEQLFRITHSCAVQDTDRCNTCNRCRERKWAFDSLALTDPGML
jgi:7-cyano-7-deazaguanine synthase in queuosine biosynthesis